MPEDKLKKLPKFGKINLTILTFLFLSTTTVGLIDETGRFPGLTWLDDEAAIPYPSDVFGTEKSSICNQVHGNCSQKLGRFMADKFNFQNGLASDTDIAW
jgi:hypothetical protein